MVLYIGLEDDCCCKWRDGATYIVYVKGLFWGGLHHCDLAIAIEVLFM